MSLLIQYVAVGFYFVSVLLSLAISLKDNVLSLSDSFFFSCIALLYLAKELVTDVLAQLLTELNQIGAWGIRFGIGSALFGVIKSRALRDITIRLPPYTQHNILNNHNVTIQTDTVNVNEPMFM